MPDASPKRLHEHSTSPYYTEKFEIFKRIHTQQNRELARVNSMYAIKIQKLENEVIALRNENLELRVRLLRSEHNEIHEGTTHDPPDSESNIHSTDTQSNNQSNGEEHQSDEKQQNTQEKADMIRVARRIRPPVNYALPSIKKKLRKGDPYTFKTWSE